MNCFIERIINISDLEQILETERILIEVLNKELEGNQLDMEKIKMLSKEIRRQHKKACAFEFHLDGRRFKMKGRIFLD